MKHPDPPEARKDYEGLIRIIHDRYDGMSKSYQRIAEYLTQNPNDVAVLSVNAIAEICGVHASGFVRFAQALGYTGFKDLQRVFQRRLSTAAPGFEARVQALERELADGTRPESPLRDLVLRDMASLQDLLDPKIETAVARAASMLDTAQAVYLVGQLRSAPLVHLMQYLLTMLGKRAVLLDDNGGLATHRAKLATDRDLLFAVSFRFYATEVVNIAEETQRRGVPILAISDSTLSPLAKSADLLIAVPEHEYTFSRSLAAPMCLVQAIALALAERLQSGAAPRIPTVTQP